MSRNFRLSCLVTMVTILLGSHISFTSARHTDKSSSLQTGSRISKRDVLHPRFMDKRGLSLLERIRQLYPNYKGSQAVEEQDSSPTFEGVNGSARRSSPSTEDTLVKRLVDFLTSDSLHSYENRKSW